MLRRASRERATIVVLDDVQWDALTLYFVEYVLDYAEGDLPLIFVLLAQEEALAEREAERAHLELMRERDEIDVLRVGPLPREEHQNLVASLLRLDSELTENIASRTNGNPLFATQLVGDWVRRGVLTVTKRGFTLREGAQAELPDDIYAVWRARVERAVQDLPDGRTAMEVAATMGLRISVAEWRKACEFLRLDVPNDFLEAMTRAQLLDGREIDAEGNGWFSFFHGMLRETLIRGARERSVLAHLHGAVADALRPEINRGRVDLAERLASHLRTANRLSEAVRPLRLAAEVRRQRGDYDRALALLDAHARTLVDIEARDSHTEWGENLLTRAEIHWKQGSLTRASRVADEALVYTNRSKVAPLCARADYIRGYLDVQQGRLEASTDRLFESAQAFDLLGLRKESARALRGLAFLSYRRGNRKVAHSIYQVSLETCRAYEDDHGAAASLAGLGFSSPTSPHGDPARLREALAIFERIGDLYGVASTLNNLAECVRKSRDSTTPRADEAEALYQARRRGLSPHRRRAPRGDYRRRPLSTLHRGRAIRAGSPRARRHVADGRAPRPERHRGVAPRREPRLPRPRPRTRRSGSNISSP